MADATSGACQPGEQSFESCLAELQDLVRLLEGGTLGLADSISGFERGISLLRQCYGTLEQAEQKIEILTGFERSGTPRTVPFDAASTLETGQRVAARRKKTAIEPALEPASQSINMPDSAIPSEPNPGAELSLPEEGQLF